MSKPKNAVEATDDQPVPFVVGRVVALAGAQFVCLHMQSLQPAKIARSATGTMISGPAPTAPANDADRAKPLSACRATFLIGNSSVEIDLLPAQVAELASDPSMVGHYEVQFVRRAPVASASKEIR